MKKILTVIFQYGLLCVLLYGFLPTIVWIFGGNFTYLSHNEIYIVFGSITSLIVSAIILENIEKDHKIEKP